MGVPQFDLGRAAARIRPELEERWGRLVDATSFIGGDEVAEFEQAFADLTGSAGCVGVANGTDAIELALRALDVGPGAEVIVPAYTFVATGTAVTAHDNRFFVRRLHQLRPISCRASVAATLVRYVCPLGMLSLASGSSGSSGRCRSTASLNR